MDRGWKNVLTVQSVGQGPPLTLLYKQKLKLSSLTLSYTITNFYLGIVQKLFKSTNQRIHRDDRGLDYEMSVKSRPGVIRQKNVVGKTITHL